MTVASPDFISALLWQVKFRRLEDCAAAAKRTEDGCSMCLSRRRVHFPPMARDVDATSYPRLKASCQQHAPQKNAVVLTCLPWLAT